MRLKTSKWKKVTYSLIWEEKRLYNWNVGFTKLAKVFSYLCEQKLVY